MDKNREIEIFKFYLMKKRSNLLTLTGRSMYPTLRDGWELKVKPVDGKEIRYGDIVVFDQNGLICHRIIAKFRWNKKLYFVHRGDPEAIGRVLEEKDLVGRVIEVFDAEGKRIDENAWKWAPEPSFKFRILNCIYPTLFLIKRLFFGKRQSRFTRWIRKVFWKFYSP